MQWTEKGCSMSLEEPHSLSTYLQVALPAGLPLQQPTLPTPKSPATMEDLPVELMIIILDEITRDSTEETYYISLGRLRAVCAFWNAIVEGTPTFWTIISNGYPKSLIKKALELSGKSPIRVIYDVDDSAELAFPDQHFLRRLASHAYRWHTVQVRSHDRNVFQHLSKLHLPMTEYLSVTYLPAEDSDNSDSLPLFILPNAPKLRNLVFIGQSLQLPEQFIPSDLFILAIHGSRVSYRDLTTMLCQSPGMEILTLDKVTVIDIPLRDDALSIKLPLLRAAELYHLERQPLDRLLSCIGMPPCAGLDTIANVGVNQHLGTLDPDVMCHARTLVPVTRSFGFHLKVSPRGQPMVDYLDIVSGDRDSSISARVIELYFPLRPLNSVLAEVRDFCRPDEWKNMQSTVTLKDRVDPVTGKAEGGGGCSSA